MGAALQIHSLDVLHCLSEAWWRPRTAAGEGVMGMEVDRAETSGFLTGMFSSWLRTDAGLRGEEDLLSALPPSQLRTLMSLGILNSTLAPQVILKVFVSFGG